MIPTLAYACVMAAFCFVTVVLLAAHRIYVVAGHTMRRLPYFAYSLVLLVTLTKRACAEPPQRTDDDHMALICTIVFVGCIAIAILYKITRRRK